MLVQPGQTKRYMVGYVNKRKDKDADFECVPFRGVTDEFRREGLAAYFLIAAPAIPGSNGVLIKLQRTDFVKHFGTCRAALGKNRKLGFLGNKIVVTKPGAIV